MWYSFSFVAGFLVVLSALAVYLLHTGYKMRS
jgi:hypothetical protein